MASVQPGLVKNRLSVAESVWLPMMALLVMLAQEVFAVIVAVRRADDYMDVIFIGLLVLAKRNAPLVIELDDNHRALNAIIKNAVIFHTAHPAKMSIAQVPLHFLHSYSRMIRAHPSDMQLDQAKQKVVLRR
jgi:uncharacterized membrane protein